MQATFQKIALLQSWRALPVLGGGPRAPTRRGVEDSVDAPNACAEPAAARQRIISAGDADPYRGNLRALIGADAQSMPAIHPVALPALQETLPPSLSFEAAGPPSDLQALRGPPSRRCGERPSSF